MVLPMFHLVPTVSLGAREKTWAALSLSNMDKTPLTDLTDLPFQKARLERVQQRGQ